MWSAFVLVYLTVLRVEAQKGPGGRPYDNGHGWDIRYAVPGEPQKDYPTLSEIPRTSFTCAKKEPGYYADVETNCQVFRICTLGSTYGFQSFLCPNGTLFNQAVFVCDWWMNVNCKKSPEYFNSNEKNSKLRVGPELMTSVKMMLTHPMRNPYDKATTKNNLVAPQEYIPPYRLVNANRNANNENERNIDNFYIQSKPANIRQEPNSNDLSFAASTGTPFYGQNQNTFQQNTPRQFQNYATFETVVAHPTSAQIRYYNPNAEKQRLGSQNQLKLQQPKQQFLNTNEYIYSTGNANNGVQYLRKTNQLQSTNIVKQPNYQAQKRVYGNKIPKQNSLQRIVQRQSNTATKQNIVSNNIPPTLITKTLTYRKSIPNPQKGQPKSRIVFKTWILKPSRSARLVADPTPYTYNRPKLSGNLVSEGPYRYEKPNDSFSGKIQETGNLVSEGPYRYEKPNYSFSGKIQDQNAVTRITPTTSWAPSVTVSNNYRQTSIPTTRSTISDRLYLAPLTAAPTKAAIVYLPPTTYKPASLMYLPPVTSAKLQAQQNVQNTPTSGTQQSYFDSDTETIPFGDVLTKEKLDITVKDIVENTNKIIKTQSTQPNNNLLVKENIQINNEPPVDFYLPGQINQDTEEEVTSLSQEELPKSSRLVALPSTELEPPNEIIDDDSENSISMTPIIKETSLPENTIERTVSLKITIPEKVANFIFKNRKTSITDDLEILNTGSSNYLVLNSKDSDSFVPLGKLTLNGSSNHSSNSQALVYSIIADSINAAKQYTNIAQQETPSTQSTTTQEQEPDKNTEVEQFSNKETQSTSSRYTSNNNNVQTNQRQQQQQLRPNEQRVRQNDESAILNQQNILSGQLYQLPVPVVTKQIYNAPLKNAWTQTRQNLVESRNEQKDNYFLQQIKAPQKNVEDNLELQATVSTDVDEKTLDNTFESEFIKQIKNSNNRIAARIHDKTVGTINHPSENNKLITYNKDKTYYVYTELNNNANTNAVPIHEGRVHKDELNLHHVTHLQTKLGTDEDTYSNNRVQSNNIGSEQDNIEVNDVQNTKGKLVSTSNVDYEVEHRLPAGQVQRINNVQKLSRLYDGPSSYSAPQNSIGNLQNYNSRLEDLENNNSNNNNNNIDDNNSADNNNNDFNGYARERPAKRFLF